MGYRNLKECVRDLEKHRDLVRIDIPVDPRLEIAAIQRRVFKAGGPALFFTRVKNCAFPALGNLYGTRKRIHFLFRDTIENVLDLARLKKDPASALKNPAQLFKLPLLARRLKPRINSSGAVTAQTAKISDLPQIVSWPQDGGAFITLPQVYTEDVTNPGWSHSNLGMYRIQLSGNHYTQDRIGLHYQIHRGIGVHQTRALEAGKPFRVNIFVGGPPAMTVAAVMPLPESMPEISFAGLLAGHPISLVKRKSSLPLLAEADFCITGTVIPNLLWPEGPFGDHLGYYSLKHDYPVLQVENVYHRKDAIWPFTTVGRPPQEDSFFGEFIHELTDSVIPTVLPGVKAVHAVDATGVHPLLLAIGSERYTPYAPSDRPAEILTQTNAILGQGQLSLAKYLLIADGADNPALDIKNIPAFFAHLLERTDFSRDLHFQTETTIDTLDYSGGRVNEGSKLVIAVRGQKRRTLAKKIHEALDLPEGFSHPRVVAPGILAIQAPAYSSATKGPKDLDHFSKSFEADHPLKEFPLIVLVDDAEMASRSFDDFLWVTFTRSNPAQDIGGIAPFTLHKHWGCHGSLIIDARLKPHHAPPLEEDPAIEKRVDELGKSGGPLHGII